MYGTLVRMLNVYEQTPRVPPLTSSGLDQKSKLNNTIKLIGLMYFKFYFKYVKYINDTTTMLC